MNADFKEDTRIFCFLPSCSTIRPSPAEAITITYLCFRNMLVKKWKKKYCKTDGVFFINS